MNFGVITACNPDGRLASEEDNAQATQALRRALESDGYRFFPVTGASPDFSHAEPGFGVVFETPEQAITWGRRFRQEAVFWICDGIVALLPCDEGDPVHLGSWESLTAPVSDEPSAEGSAVHGYKQ